MGIGRHPCKVNDHMEMVHGQTLHSGEPSSEDGDACDYLLVGIGQHCLICGPFPPGCSSISATFEYELIGPT